MNNKLPTDLLQREADWAFEGLKTSMTPPTMSFYARWCAEARQAPHIDPLEDLISKGHKLIDLGYDPRKALGVRK